MEILCVTELMVLLTAQSEALNSAEVSVLLQLLWTADYFLLVILSRSLAPGAIAQEVTRFSRWSGVFIIRNNSFCVTEAHFGVQPITGRQLLFVLTY